MTTDTLANSPPEIRTQLPVVHSLRKTITYNNPGTTVAMTVGVVPADSVIIGVWAVVKTAFNDSGTDLLDVYIGTNGGTTQFISAVSCATIGLLIASDDLATQTVSWSASAQTIKAIYTGQNANASAGEADIVVAFIPNFAN